MTLEDRASALVLPQRLHLRSPHDLVELVALLLNLDDAEEVKLHLNDNAPKLSVVQKVGVQARWLLGAVALQVPRSRHELRARKQCARARTQASR